jgi:hypothetical protein
VERACDHCGKAYVAKRASSRFCKSSCRAMHSKAPGTSAVVALKPVLPVSDGVAASVEVDLVAAERLGTPAGRAAMVLARRLDNGVRETGPGLATLARQLESTLAAALAGAPVAGDGIDELKGRRDAKFA